jgi:8-oxo-dGTP pyrophosphatase MutT (NUDIX family)
MYKIYFGNRYISLSSLKEESKGPNIQLPIICKSKKSFDKAYIDFKNDKEKLCLNIINLNPAKLFKHLKKKFLIIQAAGGLVENNENKTLVMMRFGVWDLPKGKIEKGEKKKQAAIREVEEECGITDLKIENKIGKSYHTYKLNEKLVLKITHWYKMNYSGNEQPVPQTKEGITEIRWVGKEELGKIKEISYPNLSQIFEFALQS